MVASIRLNFLAAGLDLRQAGARTIPCDAPFRKGAEMGWFEHGSTIIVFAPDGLTLCEATQEGSLIRMGQPLMRLP